VTLLVAALLAADTLVVGVLEGPASLDPHRATDLVSAAVAVNVCEPLVRYRDDGSRPEGALAAAWATLDSRTWTFTLREGVRFHDGRAFDADAVVANLARLRRERGFEAAAARLGPAHVSVTLPQPNAALLATLSQPYFCMLSPASFAADGPRLVGTGPFRLDSAAPGEILLVRHRSPGGAPPRLRRVLFRRLPSEEALGAGLAAGTVDVSLSLGPDTVARVQGHPGVALQSRTGLNLAFLSLNNERGPLREPLVRQAVARSIDREGLVREVLGGHGEPARNPLPPALWGYGRLTRALPYDPDGARRLLARAGHASGVEATLLTVDAPRPYLPTPLRLAARVRDDLARAGVRLRLVQAPSWPEYLRRATEGDYDLALLGWEADTMDPNDFLSVLLSSAAVGTTNRSRYRSRAMDALLEQARHGTNQAERRRRYDEAQELFQKDMPWVPLYHASVFTASRRTVRGLTVGPTGIMRFDRVWKDE
jgi:peptide/nickel transport system substrate-binding protein